MPNVVLPWLAEHVDLPADLSAEQLAADLVSVGLEEEAIHSSGVTGPLVVGRVLEVSPEPQKNGKVINWCQLDTGERDEAGAVVARGVICGAHNFGPGDAVVVALPGAVLPGDFVIASRKTYGHVSNGMICSAAELGLDGDPRYANDGIIVLATAAELASDPTAAPAPGTDALELLGLADEVLEINVTPDRGYCFSVRGVAREYAHATGAQFRDPGLPAPAGTAPATPEATPQAFAVVLADDAPIHGNPGCDRFVTRVVRGVAPGAASPPWLADRLRKAGMRPISLAVDATNYVMLDLGQPLHAYDLAQVAEPIVVRRARAGERLVTLDDADRALDPEDLLITDSPAGEQGARAIGIGGVMGGASTEVSPETTDVLIEAAHFDPVTIARSARRHKLPSEASRRFERGVDPRLQAIAAQRVVDLLVRYGGGVADDERVGDVGTPAAAAPIVLDPGAVSGLVGVDYEVAEVAETLASLGAEVQAITGPESEGGVTELLVTPPSWRPDLTAPEDLIEEVVRLRGYHAVPSVLPRANAGRGLTRSQRLRRAAERTLAEAGLVQVLSFPFVSPCVHDDLGEPPEDPRRAAERLANPLAEDAPALRTSLLATLLSTAARNAARGVSEVAVYETGAVTQARPGGVGVLPAGGAYPGDDVVAAVLKSVPHQARHVAAVLASASRSGADDAERAQTAIALVARLAAALGTPIAVAARAVSDPHAPFHPGRCAEITTADGLVLGHAGELAPSVAKAFGLGDRPAAFELDLDALVAAAGPGLASEAVVGASGLGKLSTFPLAKEDLAFTVAESVPAESVRRAIAAAAGDLAESVELFDVYSGEQVGAGNKSLAFALRLRAPDRTLTAAETAAVRAAAVAAVAEQFGGELRA